MSDHDPGGSQRRDDRPRYPTTPFPAGDTARVSRPATARRSGPASAVLTLVGVLVGVVVGLVAGGAVIAAGVLLGLATGTLGFYGDGSAHAGSWSTATLLLGILAGLAAGSVTVRAALT